MIYLDASFVCSLHFQDAGTVSALRLLQTAREPLLICPLVELETVNAFSLRVFRGELAQGNVEKAIRDLEADILSGLLQLLPFPELAFARAKSLARSLTPSIGIRAADLLHVAAAIELEAGSFYTFDRKQHAAAKAAGLRVNPLD